ncbi:ATP-dependent 6-phosphofructokinase [Candidatus Methylacidiphilum infernorum]|uniref:ATP-dependent 6-phosphofructokinase n=1 Tax=Candidatus Methylacidiphilum infernorum TaxID=511746 RepID=A0ABX7PX39_9BACT|nr:ATP-dependent 6-phosphofructokinase [Candidatus Methylacidiphilum infernorum]QSR87527.1 ATP-dependent 6-phosphofructokinase [Candidatus Methylacidiphilum infernorum]
MKRYRIGVLTSGGDCPGLNAAIRAVVCSASLLGWEVFGFIDGFEGLISPVRYQILNEEDTQGIISLGGTILGTTNRGRFTTKTGIGEVMRLPAHLIDEVKETLEGLGIGAIICIGGDGSLTAAQQLYEEGVPIVGVPKTIDNDLSATDYTFGFYSAVEFVCRSLDRLRTTAASHRRVMIVEVMGRYTGWIALYGGLAGGANLILIPEIPFEYSKIAYQVRKRIAEGNFQTMIVVAEGARPKEDPYYVVEEGKERPGEPRLGGVSRQLERVIHQMTGQDTRAVVLGHLQRGGEPTAFDRNLGMMFGAAAVGLIREKRFGYMVSYREGKIGSVPILEAIKELKKVDVHCPEIQTARAMGISFGEE